MIIDTRTVEDFLQILSTYKIVNKVIHVDRTQRVITEEDHVVLVSEIILQASAVIEYDDGGQALVRVGETCGIDRLSEKETDGTMRRDTLCEVLQTYRTDVQILPGMIDLV